MKFWRLLEAKKNKGEVRFLLPITNDLQLNPDQISIVKMVIKYFLNSFILSVNNLKVKEGDDEDKGLDVYNKYIYLPFGVIDRLKNQYFCYHKDENGVWIMYEPEEMCNKTVNMIMNYIDGVNSMRIAQELIKNSNKKAIAYEFKMDVSNIHNYFPDYKTTTGTDKEYVYCKFDIRFNVPNWNQGDAMYRKLVMNINSQKEFFKIYKNELKKLKLAAISIHPAEK